MYIYCIKHYNTLITSTDLHSLQILCCIGYITETLWWQDWSESLENSNMDNTLRAICIKMREIIIERVEWWSEICKMSGQASFTQLWWVYAFTLQLDPYFWSMLSWFLTVVAPINSFFFLLLYPTRPIFVLLLSLSPPLSRPSLLGALCLPPPYWFSEVQWVEHGTSNGKGMGSIPTKFQAFAGLSLWDNLSAGSPNWIHWCILLCNWCPSVSSVSAR